MKVTLSNFQILEGENTFEFPEGINVVVGPNASGKSSMFYAIENALTNPNGVDDCINYNHNEAKVTIENNDNSLTWIRRVGSSTYIDNKNNATYVKASKLDSRDLANLGFYFDTKNRVVNIHNEWSVLFPFGESDTDMFRLFEDIFNISCSFQIIDEMKKDEQNIKSSICQAQTDKASLQNRLSTLVNITAKVNSNDLDEHINKLNECLQLTSELEKDYENFSKNYLYKNVVLPPVYDVSLLYEASHKLETINNDFENYKHLKEKAALSLPTISLDFSLPVYDDTLNNEYEQYCITRANLLSLQQELNQLCIQKQCIEEKIKQIKVCPTCGKMLEE